MRENTEVPTWQEIQDNIRMNCALCSLCLAQHKSHLRISPARGVALVCFPSASRISVNRASLSAAFIAHQPFDPMARSKL